MDSVRGAGDNFSSPDSVARKLDVSSPSAKPAPSRKSARRRSSLVYRNFNPEHSIDILHHKAGFELNGFVLHPNAAARRCWDVITAVLVVYAAWEVPRSLAFSDWATVSNSEMGIFMDVWFLTDIALNFRTGKLG